MKEDRRRYYRLPTEMVAHLRKTSNAKAGISEEMIIRNVSAGGAFIATRAPFEEGELVQFDIIIPGYREKVAVTGVVRWRRWHPEPAGMGVEFVQVEASDMEAIRRFIELRRAQTGES